MQRSHLFNWHHGNYAHSKDNCVAMTHGPIMRSLLLYTLPILISQLLQQLYNVADSAIIGRFAGAQALAALGTTSLLLSVIVNFFIGLSAGMSVITAHLFGHEEYDELKLSIESFISISLISGAAFTVIGLIFGDGFLRLLNTPGDILPSARIYLHICFFGMTAQLVYNVASSILRSLGDTKTPLYYLLICSGLNVALDALLVMHFGLGIIGVAVATVVSQLLSAVLTTVHLMKLDDKYRLSRLRICRKYALPVLTKGLPSGMQAIFMSISSLVIQRFINSFGYGAMAGMTVYSKIEGFLYYPLFSFGLATTTFVGQNDGAGEHERVRSGMACAMKVAVLGCLAMSALTVCSAQYTVKIFTDDTLVIKNALEAIYYTLPFFPLYAMNQVYIGCIRGVGNTAYPMFASLCSYCIFRVLWCITLIPRLWDMRVVYTSYDISWVIMIVILYLGKRKFIDSKKPGLQQ